MILYYPSSKLQRETKFKHKLQDHDLGLHVNLLSLVKIFYVFSESALPPFRRCLFDDQFKPDR